MAFDLYARWREVSKRQLDSNALEMAESNISGFQFDRVQLGKVRAWLLQQLLLSPFDDQLKQKLIQTERDIENADYQIQRYEEIASRLRARGVQVGIHI